MFQSQVHFCRLRLCSACSDSTWIHARSLVWKWIVLIDLFYLFLQQLQLPLQQRQPPQRPPVSTTSQSRFSVQTFASVDEIFPFQSVRWQAQSSSNQGCNDFLIRKTARYWVSPLKSWFSFFVFVLTAVITTTTTTPAATTTTTTPPGNLCDVWQCTRSLLTCWFPSFLACCCLVWTLNSSDGN